MHSAKLTDVFIKRIFIISGFFLIFFAKIPAIILSVTI